MGKRLCSSTALCEAIRKAGFSSLFASALLRYGRGEKLFAIVGDTIGLRAITCDVEGIGPEKITLRNVRQVREPEIHKWFTRVETKKNNNEWLELDESTLRFLASQSFPGSFFFDVFINSEDHVFEAVSNTNTLIPSSTTATA